MSAELLDIGSYIDKNDRALLRRWILKECKAQPKNYQSGARETRKSHFFVRKSWIEECIKAWIRYNQDSKLRFVKCRTETYQVFQRILALWD